MMYLMSTSRLDGLDRLQRYCTFQNNNRNIFTVKKKIILLLILFISTFNTSSHHYQGRRLRCKYYDFIFIFIGAFTTCSFVTMNVPIVLLTGDRAVKFTFTHATFFELHSSHFFTDLTIKI